MPRRSPAPVLLTVLPTVLLALLLGLLPTACGPTGESSGAPVGDGAAGPEGAAAASGGTEDGEDGDAALVVRAVAVTTDLRRAMAAAQRRHPGLDGRLAPLARLHAAHGDALADALPDDSAGDAGGSGRALPPTPRPARALGLLRKQEQQARRELASLAAEAESGRFARLLASIAASTAQVRLALDGAPDDAVGGPGPDSEAAGDAGGPPDGGTAGESPAEGTVPAMQDALVAEHRALWLYGVLGARTSASASPALFVAVQSAYDAHRERRDGLTARLRELGADPVAASPTYRLPTAVSSSAVVRRLARRVERATAAWWSALVATSVPPVRSEAAAALADAAQRDLAFGGRARAFPGASELEDG